jgi:lipopolysaccharide heptosyltransferase II
MVRRSVLIIKHGFSEGCNHSVSPVISYGDVFRCTCLLEDFRDSQVTWITSSAAKDLLAENYLIDRLLLADSPDELPTGIADEYYDIIINLDKRKDWCEFSITLSGNERYGFKERQDQYLPLQETLFRTIDREWYGQRYILGYQPKITPIYDVGLNHHVGKWPNKLWPKHHWNALYEQLGHKYAVSWQQSLNNVRHYIDWLSSCRLIITCDSLGLHLGLGLQKKIVALFGPTPPEQVHMYGCGMKLTPMCDEDCIPCVQPNCTNERSCMEHITVEMVVEAVESLIGTQQPSQPDKVYVAPATEPVLTMTI